MNQHIPMFPEVEADLKPAAQKNVWKPTTIAEIQKFRQAYCDNCVASFDYEDMPCERLHELALGYVASDEMFHVASSGEPLCECFEDVSP